MRRLTLLALAAVLVASAGGETTGGAATAACRDSGDRTTKLTLIERLKRNPAFLILGSSRAREAEPSFLKRLTGRTGFNAAVTGGTAADAWVMVRFTADRFPRRSRGYLWFVDAGIATNGVNPDLAADPRARRYLGQVQASTDSCRFSPRYNADGSIAKHGSRSRAERERVVARGVSRLVASIRAHPPTAQKVDPSRYAYLERTIAFMNRHGSKPVIVLNPIHPRVLAELEKYGFPKRKAALDYLGRLQQRLDFVVVDCEDIRAWGGSADEFTDATHVDRVNMRRLLRYVVARAGGAWAR